MLLFRSEEHLDRWLANWNQPRGALLTPEQCFRLAQAWYTPDRRAPAWRRFTPAEAAAILEGIGLTGDFWRLG